MDEVLIDEDQARVLDILSQIKKLNRMIALHEEGSKDKVMANQYRDLKHRFLEELKELLSSYEIEVLLKGRAA